MEVYEAINEMRAMSNRGECFSLMFMSYSYERRKSEGVVKIERAKLRKQSRKENNRFADYMLNYIDLDTMDYGMCWQPLLLEFNEHILNLK